MLDCQPGDLLEWVAEWTATTDHVPTPLKEDDRMKYVVAVLAIAVGVAGVVAGGVDDSPGLQLLSVLLIIGAVAVCVRTALRSR